MAVKGKSEKSEKPVVYFFTSIAGIFAILGFALGVLGTGIAVVEMMDNSGSETLLAGSVGLIIGSTMLGLLHEISISVKKLTTE